MVHRALLLLLVVVVVVVVVVVLVAQSLRASAPRLAGSQLRARTNELAEWGPHEAPTPRSQI